VLISEEHSHGANYLGATLERIAASAD
jgi:hypothetical protein